MVTICVLCRKLVLLTVSGTRPLPPGGDFGYGACNPWCEPDLGQGGGGHGLVPGLGWGRLAGRATWDGGSMLGCLMECTMSLVLGRCTGDVPFVLRCKAAVHTWADLTRVPLASDAPRGVEG
jgi:hypothetical protein